MLSLLSLLVVTSAAAATELTPTAPGPDDSYAAGSPCTIQWNADTSGKWNNVSIYLMSGSNDNVTRLTTVASGLDGTDDGLSPYNWRCPAVDPYSAIYFYKFTNGNDSEGSKWTARFAITSPSGDSDPPEHKIQPDGDAIPWGEGRLVADDSNQTQNIDSASTTSIPDTVEKISDTQGSADASSSSGESTSRTHKHTKSTISDAQSDTTGSSHSATTAPRTTSTHSAPRSSSTSSNGLVDASIPTAGLPTEKTHPSHTRTHSSSSPSGSAALSSQMGPGIPAVGGMQLASSGRVQRRNLWPKAVSLYPLLIVMLL
ncbi:hypothetical protein C8T65DRAFT_569074 [Cerioporus squamosus]|nr:hypothetical protein C8T65DRAFT_569074 [Cerioporus squamosus]